MTTPKRHSHWLVRTGATFALGFGAMWWFGRGSEPPRPAREVRAPDPRPAAPVRVSPIANGLALANGLAPDRARSAAPEPDAIRRSALSPWLRFRLDHGPLAFATEMALREALNAPGPVACTAAWSNAEVPEVTISAEIQLRGRDLATLGWGCDPAVATADARRLCECLLDRVGESAHARISDDVADDELVDYADGVALRYWRL
jgi:hypothetical protein